VRIVRRFTPWLILFSLILGLWLIWQPGGRGRLDPKATPRAVTARGDLAQDEQNTIDIFRNASPAVVNITTIALRRNLFSLNVQEIPQGTGSGFIWDEEGRIVTNFHVIGDASRVEVTLADRSTWKGTLVGAAPDQDLAVLQIAAPRELLRTLPLGSSGDLQVGQKVFAIGNPFGLDQTITSGIVSALGREITAVTGRTIQNVIQTDAAINPGNSGGPLLDSAGRLIGVNTAIYSPSGGSAGIGFAVPVAEVNRVAPELIRHGRMIRPGLGVVLADERLSRRLDLDGVLVMTVRPGSGAEKAGLRGSRQVSGGVVLGDVIVELDGKPVRSPNELRDAVERRRLGETVRLTLLRDGSKVQAQVTLEAAE